ncbi:MAG: SDR family oxidoreductase [Candidatus Omnitrophota bacterium]|nr:SDR family oxidoreductase [Candidatus Omnitrophota bacterium]
MRSSASDVSLTRSARSLAQLMDLSGRKALVTGGAGHLGSMICETLTELGANVAVLDQDAAAVEQQVKALGESSKGGRAIALPCDLRNEQATRRAIREAREAMGGLGILIHCAAHVGTTQAPGWAVPFDQQTVAAWNAALQVNVTSAFVMTQEAKPALLDSGHGTVIFLASIYGMAAPDPRLYEGTDLANPAAYGVSKAGLLQLTRYLATTLAPHVRVNAITPGGIWRDQPEVFHQRYVTRTPLGRMGTEEDVKGAVAYLASDLSAYVTGQNLIVDGGWTAW